MSAIIEDVRARKIFNSRGDPTIEVDIITADGFGSASAPSGASTGKAEAVSYPKGGVEEAITKVEQSISPQLIGLSSEEQEEIDMILHEIDGTDNFRSIGGNTSYAISLAVADAAADSFNLPLFQYLGGSFASEIPCPLGNVLGGGKHASGKATDIQEFLSLPLGSSKFSEAVEANSLVHRNLKTRLSKIDPTFTGGKGDEGAWAPNISNEQALELVYDVCKCISEQVGFKCKVGLDIAASSLWNSDNETYVYSRDRKSRSKGEQIDYILELIKRYDLVYVEDPVNEDDFEGFSEITSKSKGCLICGDDLFVTNSKRLSQGIKSGACNSIIIKMNQIGTLTDTWETVRLSQNNGYVPIVSHRSGETDSHHLSHLAVAFKAPIIKTGVVGGERVSKLNELLRIWEFNGSKSRMGTIKI